jgi:hypothetical protein
MRSVMRQTLATLLSACEVVSSQNAPSDGNCRRLRQGRAVEFEPRNVEIGFDRGKAEPENSGDLGIGFAARRPQQAFTLAPRQGTERHLQRRGRASFAVRKPGLYRNPWERQRPRNTPDTISQIG